MDFKESVNRVDPDQTTGVQADLGLFWINIYSVTLFCI